MKYTLMAILATVGLSMPAVAQVIEFDVPTTVTPQLNAFTVVFVDGTRVEEAQQLVESIEPKKFTVRFNPVDITATVSLEPDESTLARLRDDERVLSFGFDKLPQGETSSVNGFRIEASIASHFTAYQARQILSEFLSFTDGTVTKRANEIEVTLAIESPQAVAILEKNTAVKYVAYLAIEE